MKLPIRVSTVLCGFALMAGSIHTLEALAVDRSVDRNTQRSRPAKQEVLFPQATRKEPSGRVTKLSGKLQKLIETYNKNEFNEAITAADALAKEPKAGPYEKAQANYIAGFSAMQLDQDNYDRTVDYFKRALEADGLANNVHFQIMQQIGQMLIAEEHYQEGLEYLERLQFETKQESPESAALRGNAMYRLNRFAEAIPALKQAIAATAKPPASWNQLLLASYIEAGQKEEAAQFASEQAAMAPEDKAAQMNLASVYLQVDMPDKASAVMDRLRTANMLTESKDYELAYRLLANLEGREKDAIAVIKEGLEKKILSPSFEVYNFLGQSYYFSEQVEPAIAAWKQAAPLAKDGETYLNLAKVQVIEAHYAEAKASAQQALAKGVKKPGDAWMAIARAEYGTNGANKSAMLAAYREAAKYPETKAQAEKQIAQMSR